MMSLVLVGVLGSAAGLIMGLLGGGGALVTVPVLAYVLGYEVNDAVAGGLVVVALASTVGLATHVRAGNVDLRRGFFFGVTAAAAAYFSASWGAHLSGDLRMLIFAIVVLAAAVLMLRSPELRSAAPARRPRLVLPVVGAGMGALTGLVGVGGGFLAVPALSVAGGLTMQRAVGTSALIISLNSLAGLAGLSSEVSLVWRDLLWFAGAASLGTMAGARIMPRLSAVTLRRLFALVLVGVECVVVSQLLF